MKKKTKQIATNKTNQNAIKDIMFYYMVINTKIYNKKYKFN